MAHSTKGTGCTCPPGPLKSPAPSQKAHAFIINSPLPLSPLNHSQYSPHHLEKAEERKMEQVPQKEQEQEPAPLKKNPVSSLFQPQTSFREDVYLAHKLRPSEKKALEELKTLLSSSTVTPPPSLWGVPLLLGDERADVILLKFLRARDFNSTHAHEMLLRCLEWRRDFSADEILEEDLGFKELEGVVAYLHGKDTEGHPVCYNAYGVFKDKELYDRVFGDEERLNRFLRWRVQIMEKGISLLQFKPGGVNSIIQVTDLKDMPKRELRVASNQILSLFQDNYPELVARKVTNLSPSLCQRILVT